MMLATNEEPYSLGDLYWRPCKSQHEHRDSYQIEYLSRIAHWADIIERLYDESQRALRSPAVQERLAKVGAEPMPMSVDEFGRYFREDVLSTAKLMAQVGIKPGD